jgi:hypothetical protein
MSERGVMTKEIRTVARDKLGIDLTVRQLRLMPHLQFIVMNNKRINPNMINQEEREILSDWRKREWVYGGAGSDFGMSKEFWDALCEIMWLGYAK